MSNSNNPKINLALVGSMPDVPVEGTVYLSPDSSGNFIKVGVASGSKTIFDGSEYAKESVSVTYSELVTLKDENRLSPGAHYRITDYACTTTQSSTASAGHAFDIIVTAFDKSTLGEEAKAVRHDGDTYFNGSKLESWELKYCLDNDTNRFAWADRSNGKGVIYYMKDEFGNECPYDFKNIMFMVGAKSRAGTQSGVYYYTFSVAGDMGDMTVTDHSLNGRSCHDNSIKECVNDSKVGILSFIVFRNTSDANECHGNTFGNGCYGNTFGAGCTGNIMSNSCQNNECGMNCYDNRYGVGCTLNVFGDNCHDNGFDNACSGNRFGTGSHSNAFGEGCEGNTFGESCIGNRFGIFCRNSTFPTNSLNCALGNYVSNITFMKSYFRNVVIDNGSGSLTIGTDLTPTITNHLQNVHVCPGVNGTLSVPKEIMIDAIGNEYQIRVENDSDSNMRIYNLPDELNGGGGIIFTTYSELIGLRDRGELAPGTYYRITDYVTTTIQANTQSAGHVFDVIVRADDVNALNENAYAALHEDDTYFANSNLGAWELKYCLDNDTTRFAWADETNGKGVIYYMKDEFDNEVPYDFKNIQFYRKWNSDTGLWSDNATSSDGIAAYTFSSNGFTASITEFTDFSIDSPNNIKSNIIKRRTSTDNHLVDDLLRLNNICFFGLSCYSNIFGESCQNNTFGYACRNNTFGADCYNNSLGGNSSYNTFSNGCSFNVLASTCNYNTFGDNCDYNRLGFGCRCNVFGKKCCYNDLSGGNSSMVDGGCSNNVFGSACGDLDSKSGIILHYGSCSNIFDANIKYVELVGENIKNYHILSSASHEGTTEETEFTQDYLTNIVIHSINGDEIVVSFFDTSEEVQYDNVTLYYDSEDPEGIHWWWDEDYVYYVATDSTSDINCQIGDDIKTVEYPGKLTVNATPDSEVVVTVARKSNGKIVQYCEADLIADQD